MWIDRMCKAQAKAVGSVVSYPGGYRASQGELLIDLPVIPVGPHCNLLPFSRAVTQEISGKVLDPPYDMVLSGWISYVANKPPRYIIIRLHESMLWGEGCGGGGAPHLLYFVLSQAVHIQCSQGYSLPFPRFRESNTRFKAWNVVLGPVCPNCEVLWVVISSLAQSRREAGRVFREEWGRSTSSGTPAVGGGTTSTMAVIMEAVNEQVVSVIIWTV